MSEYITNEQHTNSTRQKVVATAKAMLARELNFVVGARTICSLKDDAAVRSDDADFMIFVAIDSETDSYPLGDVRQYWNTDSLEKLQPEIQAAEDWAYKLGAQACSSLINRFG